MTYNSYGQILTHTDGEGNVTKTNYYSSGSNNGWVESVIRDYGTGKLNLTTSWCTTRSATGRSARTRAAT
jgi:hypothetical protein